MRTVFCLDPVTLPLETALEAALLLREGNQEARLGPARSFMLKLHLHDTDTPMRFHFQCDLSVEWCA